MTEAKVTWVKYTRCELLGYGRYRLYDIYKNPGDPADIIRTDPEVIDISQRRYPHHIGSEAIEIEEALRAWVEDPAPALIVQPEANPTAPEANNQDITDDIDIFADNQEEII